MRWAAILLGAGVLLAMTAEVSAEPRRSNGAACDSTGTARKDGKDQNGNKMNCQWDTCTYTECSTGSGSISNCVKKTEYSNPTDCHAASATTHGNQSVMPRNGGLMQLQPTPGKPPVHRPPAGAVNRVPLQQKMLK